MQPPPLARAGRISRVLLPVESQVATLTHCQQVRRISTQWLTFTQVRDGQHDPRIGNRMLAVMHRVTTVSRDFNVQVTKNARGVKQRFRPMTGAALPGAFADADSAVKANLVADFVPVCRIF